MYNNLPIWFHYRNIGKPYQNTDDPYYFDVSNLDWAISIESNWPSIAEEIRGLIAQKGEIKPYFAKNLYSGKGGWRTLGLMDWGIPKHENLKYCPQLKHLFDKYPAIVGASINLLKGSTTIEAHCGDTNGIYRCHIGLEVPDGLPACGFEVGNEKRPWVEGKIFAFCDAHKHWAFNYTEKDRIVFLFDVIRPQFMSQKTSICIQVRAFILAQAIVERLPLLLKMPQFLWFPIFILLQLFIAILYPLQRKIGRIYGPI